MNLSTALRLGSAPCLAAVGAGGKTTALFQLARELPPPVILTASTHLHTNQIALADTHVVADTAEALAGLDEKMEGVVLVTGSIDGNRTTGLNQATLERIHAICHKSHIPLLIEADGSRQRPLKAPAEHEPVIPDFVEMVLVLAGMSGLGKKLSETHVHRPEIYSRLSGLKADEIITAGALASVLCHAEGGLKGIPPGARKAALLSQVDTPELLSQTKSIIKQILPAYDVVVTASLQPNAPNENQPAFIHSVREPAAAIILAAGESRRFGRPKQLLPWNGKPLIRHITEIALSGNFPTVVVVTGAGADEIGAAIDDLPVLIYRNPDWKNGQSTSIRSGLSILPPATGAAIFLLADQPMVNVEILEALVERHSLDLSPVVVPEVGGRRTNPVLFDRTTFPDLLSLSGDVGGRALFSRYPVTSLPWRDVGLPIDIDTPEDYARYHR